MWQVKKEEILSFVGIYPIAAIVTLLCFLLRQEVLKSIDVHITILFLTTVMSNLQHLQH